MTADARFPAEAASNTAIEERVRAAYRRIEQVDRPEIWIDLRPEAEVLEEAAALEERGLPLYGKLVAVKGNIDVAGLPTTAGCPAYAYKPEADAPVVARLRAAGALVLGTTNLDQFATGLVGTRSPYGAVRIRRRPGVRFGRVEFGVGGGRGARDRGSGAGHRHRGLRTGARGVQRDRRAQADTRAAADARGRARVREHRLRVACSRGRSRKRRSR